ncbi:MAG: CRISPR-associated CARF protein Csa3 [Methanobacteriaceae archaeon]|nr:CRISPR-associated CARF protein Csa3 [Methanobacteriaceae archaeon]
MKVTLISTFYSLEPVMVAITKLSPDKLILLKNKDAKNEKLQSEVTLRKTVGRIIDINTLDTSVYDVVKIARDTAEIIDRESAEENRVIVNVSGGRKTQALGALFGSYARHKQVERIVYLTEEDNEIVEIPKLNYGISTTKKQILKELDMGNASVKNLSIKVGISRGMTYNHVRELREMGLIEPNKLEITSAGQLAII